MTTNLPTALLGLEHSEPIGDLLWQKASLNEATVARSSVTETTATALAQDSTTARSLGRLLPDPDMLDRIVRSSYSDELAAGAAENPLVRSSTLEHIKDSATAPATLGLVRARLIRTKGLVDALGTDEAVAALRTVADNDEVSTVLEALDGDNYEQTLSLLAAVTKPEAKESESDEDEDTTAEAAVTSEVDLIAFRTRVLTALTDQDPSLADDVTGRLLGVTDPSAAAVVVDWHLADWLSTSSSDQAELFRVLLVPEGGARRSEVAPEFAARLTISARSRFKQHDDLWDLVAYKAIASKPRQGRRRYDAGHPLDVPHLMALRSADVPVEAMIFSTNFALGDDEFSFLLDGVSPLAASAFLMGRTTRFCKPGQATLLLELLDEDDLAEVSRLIDLDAKTNKHNPLENLPWLAELVSYLPNAFKGQLTDNQVKAIDKCLVDHLGTDVTAWEKALDQAPTWDGTFSSLLESVA